MKILLFGATGRVGTAIVTKCLAKGYDIIAFIRNKNKLTVKSEHISFIEGDLYDNDALQKLQQADFDIVINVIGADPLKPSTIFSDATSLVIKLFSRQAGQALHSHHRHCTNEPNPFWKNSHRRFKADTCKKCYQGPPKCIQPNIRIGY